MVAPRIVVHGGVGSPLSLCDGTDAAAEAAWAVLQQGGSAVDAVVAACVVLEDDPRFNAGTGSRLRIDGSLQMDAGVMDSNGTIGSVVGIEGVANPIRVAKEVMALPHVILCGDGATRFAHTRGIDKPAAVTPLSRERLAETRKRWKAGTYPPWAKWKGYPAGLDTIGAVALDRNGLLAAGNSTGGTDFMLRGRVGDCALPGLGMFAGPAAALAATGVGEEIITRVLCYRAYALITGDVDRLDKPAGAFGPQQAIDHALSWCAPAVPVGLIALTHTSSAVAATDPMACSAIDENGRTDGATLLSRSSRAPPRGPSDNP